MRCRCRVHRGRYRKSQEPTKGWPNILIKLVVVVEDGRDLSIIVVAPSSRDLGNLNQESKYWPIRHVWRLRSTRSTTYTEPYTRFLEFGRSKTKWEVTGHSRCLLLKDLFHVCLAHQTSHLGSRVLRTWGHFRIRKIYCKIMWNRLKNGDSMRPRSFTSLAIPALDSGRSLIHQCQVLPLVAFHLVSPVKPPSPVLFCTFPDLFNWCFLVTKRSRPASSQGELIASHCSDQMFDILLIYC